MKRTRDPGFPRPGLIRVLVDAYQRDHGVRLTRPLGACDCQDLPFAGPDGQVTVCGVVSGSGRGEWRIEPLPD